MSRILDPKDQAAHQIHLMSTKSDRDYELEKEKNEIARGKADAAKVKYEAMLYIAKMDERKMNIQILNSLLQKQQCNPDEELVKKKLLRELYGITD